MKTEKYQRRFYRDWVSPADLHLTQVSLRETDLQVLTDKPVDKNYLKEKMRLYRWDIENYIHKENKFVTALKPLEVELNAPLIVREMARQARKANVGPMAAVAGAIAQFLGNDLLKKGYKDVIIENGGDIFLKSTKLRLLKIYSGESKPWNKIYLRIKAQDTPLGICASSGTIGHSLSFGCTDSAVILSGNASLADAVATATANRVNSRDDLAPALNFARAIKGVCGIVIIFGDSLIAWGKVDLLR